MNARVGRLSSLVTFALTAVLVLSAVATPAGAGQAANNPCVGEMNGEADGTTVLSIQGVHFTPDGAEKTTAMFAAVGPSGGIEWVHDASAEGRVWAYDVDPLENGNYLFATTIPGKTVVEEWNPETGEAVWSQTFRGVTDAHDADLINGDELVLVDKGQGHHRLLVYNLTRRETVWEWHFDEYFPEDGGGPAKDWTHVNDIDQIEPGRFLVSVRNFDQTIVVNRSTKEIEMRLGEDDDHSILNEQHNPAYYEGPDGTPTILVADSENDRVVEYEQTDDGWNQTYVLKGGGMREPRDADWLPNGNLLVVDRMSHRVMEVTPQGEVLWEFYTPYQPYDAERVQYGDEPDAKTSRELGAMGVHELQSEKPNADDLADCEETLNSFPPVGSDDATTNDPTDVTENDDTADPAGDDGESDDTGDDQTGPTPQPGLGVVVGVVALWLTAFGLARRS